MNQITVLLADDQTIIRDGLRALLETNPDIQVVAEARNGMEAYEQTSIHHPQVVLMDIRMPNMGGVEATRLIKQDFPETAVLVLPHLMMMNPFSVPSPGASGYLLRTSADKTADAIRDTVQGSIILRKHCAKSQSISAGRENGNIA